MKDRARFWAAAVVWAATLCVSTMPSVAGASGLAYRNVTTGTWKGIAAAGDTRLAGVYGGKTFAGFSANARAPIESLVAGVCGGSAVVVAAFEARVTGPAPNTGVFLYDALTDTIMDVAIEGGVTPIGGTWKTFNGINPTVAIDPTTCLVNVGFRGQASGVPATSDTGAFDALFGPLPALTPAGILVIAQEGVTAAPLPFPGGAVFADFPRPTSGIPGRRSRRRWVRHVRLSRQGERRRRHRRRRHGDFQHFVRRAPHHGRARRRSDLRTFLARSRPALRRVPGDGEPGNGGPWRRIRTGALPRKIKGRGGRNRHRHCLQLLNARVRDVLCLRQRGRRDAHWGYLPELSGHGTAGFGWWRCYALSQRRLPRRDQRVRLALRKHSSMAPAVLLLFYLRQSRRGRWCPRLWVRLR